jgi:hypothetical protein
MTDDVAIAELPSCFGGRGPLLKEGLGEVNDAGFQDQAVFRSNKSQPEFSKV